MKNNWQLLMHCDDDNGDRFEFRTDPLFSDTFRVFGHFFKLTGAFLVRVSGASHSKADFRFISANPNLFSQFRHAKPCFTGPSFTQLQSLASFFCNSVSNFSIKHLFGRPDIHSPFLSLAATIIPPLDNLSSNMIAVAPAEAHVQMLGSLDQTPCDVRHCGGLGHSFPDLSWIRRAVEPITGIEFPGVLNNILAKENQSNLSSEVLVGTGSRTVTIIKIKSLKVYAYGFYVHAHSVCQKLGSKYASISASELKDHNDFFADLLREDIGMTVRLVVNCKGMKVNAVKDAFEKSLRDRLVKTNPETDFKCISTFGSFFTKDIPLPVGTIIDFRRTADGQLITEIGGNQIGAVHSRELCRAFFDMYLGEVPVSKQTKEEIGSNVASLVRRC